MSKLRLLGAMFPLLLLAAGASLLETPGETATAADVCVKRFGLPRSAGGLALGSDGRLWFTEQLDDRIGAFDPETERVEEWPVPQGTRPHFMATSDEQEVWFSGLADVIGRFDFATRKVRLYRVPAGRVPHAVARLPDGKVYFTEQEGGRLGRLDPSSGRVAEFSKGLPSVNRMHGLAPDPGGRHLWVALQQADAIARFDIESAKFDRVLSFSKGSGPHDIRVGPRGRRLYVTLQYASRLGEYDLVTERIREYDTFLPRQSSPDQEPAPKLIDVIPDPRADAVWITTFAAGSLFRFDIKRKLFTQVECGVPEGGSTLEITKGPDGKLWITDPLKRSLGRVDP